MKGLLAALALALPMTTQAQTLTAQIFKMPESVEPAAVTTAGHYILASHLVRPLTKLDKFGKIQGDIAVKWVPSADHKTWTITLGDARFSDGRAITAEDVAATFARQKRLGAGVHFPFAQIAGVKTTGPKELEVTLTSARNDFIYDLSKPEFGVLSPADALAPKDGATFAVSSGPYFLRKHSGAAFTLRRNPYYKSDAQNDLDLVMENADGAASPDALASGKISFFTTQQNLSASRHAALAKSPGVRAEKPHIGFSNWLSLNTESAYFSSAAHRASFQSFVRAFRSPLMDGHSWEKADQLYLPDGDGRPTASQLEATWKGIEAHAQAPAAGKPKLRVVPLKMTNDLLEELLAYLRRRYEIEMVPYSTEDELIAILKSKKFDVKISSNDFSSIDLSENLKTTFNATRPYIFLNHGSKVPALLQRAVETTDKSAQSKIFQEIALIVLHDGLVAPLAYQRIWFYYDKRLDTGAWSKLFPEISMWKARVAGCDSAGLPGCGERSQDGRGGPPRPEGKVQ